MSIPRLATCTSPGLPFGRMRTSLPLVVWTVLLPAGMGWLGPPAWEVAGVCAPGEVPGAWVVTVFGPCPLGELVVGPLVVGPLLVVAPPPPVVGPWLLIEVAGPLLALGVAPLVALGAALAGVAALAGTALE